MSKKPHPQMTEICADDKDGVKNHLRKSEPFANS